MVPKAGLEPAMMLYFTPFAGGVEKIWEKVGKFATSPPRFFWTPDHCTSNSEYQFSVFSRYRFDQ
jgi:hypothetical protein